MKRWTYTSLAVSVLCASALAQNPDFDGSGMVDLDDFFLFADAFGGTGATCDMDNSGQVDFDDFFIFAEYFGQAVPVIDGVPPPAVQTISYGQSAGEVELLSDQYILEVVVPPSTTSTAPFDSAVLPGVGVLMAGNYGTLVSVSADGQVVETEHPSGMNFEADDDGVMWYYDWVNGILSYWQMGADEAVCVADLPPVYTDGSIAVSPDGMTVFVGWWQADYDIDSYRSALYRYTREGGLVRLFNWDERPLLHAVEVTGSGQVYIAMSDGIYRLNSDDTLEAVCRSVSSIRSDALTSDGAGNLYFAAYDGQAVYRLTPGGAAERLASFSDPLDLPFGLSWDAEHQEVVGVRKEKGELISIDPAGTVRVLNQPTGLITPIAVEEHPSGSIFVNGDEVGLLSVDGEGRVSCFAGSSDTLASYQPPVADFAFAANGLIYYTCACPGFASAIVTVGPNGRVQVLTTDVGSPAGIDIDGEGAVYYADYERGGVYRLARDGSSVVVREDVLSPVGLVVDDGGNIWVGAAEPGGPTGALDEVFNTRILRFRAGEEPVEVVDFPDDEWHAFHLFDVDEEGKLYLPDGDDLWVRSENGDLTKVATGFQGLAGATVAGDGRVYLTEWGTGAMYRLTGL